MGSLRYFCVRLFSYEDKNAQLMYLLTNGACCVQLKACRRRTFSNV